jgi:hypothetical protein
MDCEIETVELPLESHPIAVRGRVGDLANRIGTAVERR